jgi:hypothetical protein
VDHVQNYKAPKTFDEEGNEIEPDEDTINNVAPKPIEGKTLSHSTSEQLPTQKCVLTTFTPSM